MAINTDTLLELIEYLAESNNDFISVATTTNIAGSSTVILSTALNSYDNGVDDTFNNWWCYLNTTANASVLRKVSDYATSGGSVTLHGANLSAESAAQTIYLFRYNRDHYKNAVIEACKEVYPALHVDIDNQTLITGNFLPDGHLDSWSSATALTYWTATNATLARTSTVGYIRGGTYSAKLTASAANGNISVSSNTYKKLLQLQNQTVSAYIWAYPEEDDDCTIIIDTVSNDGTTTQTLTSTTSCPAGYWTLIKLEDQVLNDDLQEVKFTLNVATNTKYCYFDDAYFGDVRLAEYILPDDFVGGRLGQVWVQTNGVSDQICYDASPFVIPNWSEQISFRVNSGGTFPILDILNYYHIERRLRLIGDKPLETLSADTDTITLDTWRIPLLIAKARMIFWKREATPLNVEDKSKFEYEYNKAKRDYSELLIKMRMSRPMELKHNR